MGNLSASRRRFVMFPEKTSIRNRLVASVNVLGCCLKWFIYFQAFAYVSFAIGALAFTVWTSIDDENVFLSLYAVCGMLMSGWLLPWLPSFKKYRWYLLSGAWIGTLCLLAMYLPLLHHIELVSRHNVSIQYNTTTTTP